MLGYLGAIFLGPFPPLAVYLARRRKSRFIRYHCAQALNLSVTCLLYVISGLILGGLLALDSAATALIIMIPVALALWIVMLTHLIRGAIAANRGEQYQIPTWICATMAK